MVSQVNYYRAIPKKPKAVGLRKIRAKRSYLVALISVLLGKPNLLILNAIDNTLTSSTRY